MRTKAASEVPLQCRSKFVTTCSGDRPWVVQLTAGRKAELEFCKRERQLEAAVEADHEEPTKECFATVYL